MKKFHYLLVIFIFYSCTLHAQNDSIQGSQTDSVQINQIDSILINKKWYGTTFLQNNKTLNIKELSFITNEVPESKKLIKTAKSFYTTGLVFAYSGGALIGWPIGTALGGGNPNWGIAGIGGGLVILSFIFESISIKYLTKAVNIYNQNSLTSYKINIQMGMLDTGVGLRINF